MSDKKTRDALNQLYQVHYRSLPSYLGYATPFVASGDEAAKELLDRIAQDHGRMATRVGDFLMDQNLSPDPGEFPMEFTFYHDLGYDFLVRQVSAHQSAAVDKMKECVAGLADAPAAKELAEEALGTATGHQESLQELLQAPAESA